MLGGAGAGGHPLWHLGLAMVSPVALSAVLAARRRWLPGTDPALIVLAAASVVAGGIHAAVCPAHFREAPAFGVFFASVAVLQAAWAGWVVARPGRAPLLVGAAGNLAVVALWLMTRTSGLPLGPSPWRAERFGALDVLASLLEVVVAGGALLLSRDAVARRVGIARRGQAA